MNLNTIEDKITYFFDSFYKNIVNRLNSYNFSLEKSKTFFVSLNPLVKKCFTLGIYKKHMGGIRFIIEIYQAKEDYLVIEISIFDKKFYFEVNSYNDIDKIESFFQIFESDIMNNLHSIKTISPKELFDYINNKFLLMYKHFNSISEDSKFDYSIYNEDGIEKIESTYGIKKCHYVDIFVEIDNNLLDRIAIKINMICDCEVSDYDNEKETLISTTEVILDKINPNLKELELYFNKIFKELEKQNELYL